MNVVLQVFVFTTVIAVAQCAAPSQHQAALQLVTKLHRLHQAGLVPEDVVETACTVSGPFLLGCTFTPAEPACTAAGAACGVYSFGKWMVGKLNHMIATHQIGR